MPHQLENESVLGSRYALCIGIGSYSNPKVPRLRYAIPDATIIAERLADPQRGNFVVRVLTEQSQTTKAFIDQVVEQELNAADRRADDVFLLYFSCHGDFYKADNTFSLVPSDATQQTDGVFEQTTLITISDLARWFSQSGIHNIILLLDVCHSGGAGLALQHFDPHLEVGPNYFILGASRQDRVSEQSSTLEHGVFTYCLLRAFEQTPTKDGWLTISQIQNFVSEEIPWFAKDQPLQIQISSMFVNPHLPLVRNPGYPELCPLPPVWNVPFPRNRFFIEQDDVVSHLANLLYNEQTLTLTQSYALSGLGGIGKTQLALEYTYRHRQNYHAVLWGRADTRENLITSFIAIASLLGLPQKDEKDQMIIVEAVKTWLQEHDKWLLILDNADELDVTREFIPHALRGHLLLTTRAQSMGRLTQRFEVKMMNSVTGALLLLRRAGLIAHNATLETASPADITLAKDISEELGGLPLALDQAGAYLEETQCSLLQYQNRYRTRRMTLLKTRGGLIDDHPNPVATTWSLSFEKVEQQSATATDLLRVCAFLAPDVIPEEIIVRGASQLGEHLQGVVGDQGQLDDAIRVLTAYSLIHRNNKEETLSVHRLVQSVIRDAMEREKQHTWITRVIRAITHTLPDVDTAPLHELRGYLPHMLMCDSFLKDGNVKTEDAIALLRGIVSYSYQIGDYSTSISFANKASEIQPDDSWIYVWRGMTFRDIKDYKRALHDMNHALSLDPTNIWIYVHRALVYVKLKDNEHALDDLNTVISFDSNNAWLYVHRALIYVEGKDYERALHDMNHALSLNPTYSGAHVHRAHLYWHINEYQRAFDDMDVAISLDPSSAWVRVNCALLYIEHKDYERALHDMNVAVSLDPSNIWVRVHRTLLNTERKDYEQALHDMNVAVSLDPNNAWVRVHRALVYAERKDYKNALDEINIAVSLDPNSAWVRVHRARLYGRIDEYQHALDEINTAISLDPNNAWVHVHRAFIYRDSNNFEQALQDIDRAIALDPFNTDYFIHRAETYHASGEYQSALQDLDHVLAINANEPRAYVARALTYKAISNFEQALKDLNSTNEIMPKDAKVYIERSSIHLLMGNLQQAQADIVRGKEIELIQGKQNDHEEPEA